MDLQIKHALNECVLYLFVAKQEVDLNIFLEVLYNTRRNCYPSTIFKSILYYLI